MSERIFEKGDFIDPEQRYLVIRVLGRGGMARVYLAKDMLLKREVAVKMLINADMLNGHQKRRFKREALMSAKLSHPNLVPVFDSLFFEDSLMFVQEYVRGSNLEELVNLGRIEELEVQKLAWDLARALAYLHENDVVHRDIKPANIMRDERGPYRLMDLGLARNPEYTRMTEEGSILGTLLYLPPEIIVGEEATPASDVYQLGLVLHQAASGQSLQKPQGKAKDLEDFLKAGLDRHEIAASVPKEMKQVIAACCHRNPEDRLQDGKQVLDFLEKEAREGAPMELSLEDQRQSRALSPTSKFLATALGLVIGLLAVLLSLSSPEAETESRNLFSLASYREVMPEYIAYVFPKGVLQTPRWQIEMADGSLVRGKARRLPQGGWRLSIPKPVKGRIAKLSLYSEQESSSIENLSFPKEPFAHAPRALYSYHRFELHWKLHGSAPVELELLHRTSKKRLFKKRVSTSSISHEVIEELGRDRRVLWTMSLSGEEIARGQGALGLGLRFRMEAAKKTTQQSEQALLCGAYSDGEHLFLAKSGGDIVALKPQRTEARIDLKPSWTIETDALTTRSCHFIPGAAPRDGWALLKRAGRIEVINLYQRQRRRSFALNMARGYGLALPQKRLLYLYNQQRVHPRVHAALFQDLRLEQDLHLKAKRCFGLFQLGGEFYTIISLGRKLLAKELRLQSAKATPSKAHVLGPAPVFSPDASYYLPNKVITQPLGPKELLIAYDRRAIVFSPSGVQRELKIETPKKSYFRYAFSDKQERLYLLTVGPSVGVTATVRNQSRLFLYLFEKKGSGLEQIEAGCVIPAILKSRYRAHAWGRSLPDGRILLSCNAHFLVLNTEGGFRREYKAFEYLTPFRYGFFILGQSIYLPSPKGLVYGMELFSQSKEKTSR